MSRFLYLWFLSVPSAAFLSLSAGASECPSENPLGDRYCMDPNGDGQVDVSDAVHLLQFVFLRGENRCGSCSQRDPALLDEIERLLEELSFRPSLPPTGQDLCYDNLGRVIDCGSPDFPGQDASRRSACRCSPEERFILTDHDTVIDRCTGLEWQRGPADANGDGAITRDKPFDNPGPDQVTWGQALRYCASLILTKDGRWIGRKPTETADQFAARIEGEDILYDDWRLPDIHELHSIVDLGKDNPCIDPAFDVTTGWTRPDGQPSMTYLYWSSTTSHAYPDQAMLVGFGGGAITGGGGWYHLNDGTFVYIDIRKASSLFFRAVRTVRPCSLPGND